MTGFQVLHIVFISVSRIRNNYINKQGRKLRMV